MKNNTKRNKIAARIGAILACVLLVGTLTISAFADYTPSYGDAVASFTSMIDPRANNYAYNSLLDWYRGYGDSRFFDISTLVSGSMLNRNADPYTFVVLFPFIDLNGNLNGRIPVDYFNYAVFYNDTVSPAKYSYGLNGYIEIVLYFESTDCTLWLYYYPENNSVPLVSFKFNGVIDNANDNIVLSLAQVSYGSGTITSEDIYSVDIAFVPTYYDDNLLTATVACLFDDVGDYFYKDKVYSPKQFYYGFNASYNLGYSDGERYTYPLAYQEGKDDGIAEGFEQGVNSVPDVQEAFQNGYDEALSQISSGDFGRNFLSGIFTAPLDALSDFTIVQWQTDSGTEITISLMSILSAIVGLSLFIWFLKMFAGG